MSERLLLVDIGNSRVKWSVLDGDRLGAMMSRPLNPLEEWLEEWSASGPFARVAVSNVSTTDIDEAISAWCIDNASAEPLFVKSAARAFGVGKRLPDAGRTRRRPVGGANRRARSFPGTGDSDRRRVPQSPSIVSMRKACSSAVLSFPARMPCCRRFAGVRPDWPIRRDGGWIRSVCQRETG